MYLSPAVLANGKRAKELPLKEPLLRSIIPMGGRVGQTVEVELAGEFLDQPRSIICDCSDVTGEITSTDSFSTQAKLQVARNAEPGPRLLYIHTVRGISNSALFRVTAWDSLLEQEPNNWLEEAQKVSLPAVVEGKIATLTDSDFYQFQARAGERLAFNLMMARNRLGGNLILTLLDAKGAELEWNISRFGPDPYLDYTFEEAGTYLLVITPRRFADFFTVIKDDQPINYRYQLAIGRSPILWSLFPMGARRGTKVEAQLRADFLDPQAQPRFSGQGVKGTLKPTDDLCHCKFKLSLEVSPDADLGLHHLTFGDPSGNVMPLAFVVSDFAEIIEEPTSENSAQVVKLPVLINGRIDGPDDRDNFRFYVDQDEELTFEVDARGLGSALTDPQLALRRAEGDMVADGDDRNCERLAGRRMKCPSFYDVVGKKERLDPKFGHAFISANPNDADAAGDYILQILDMSMEYGDGYNYRALIRKKHPGFRVGALTDRVNAPRGGVAKIPLVILHEEGFRGEIEITAENPPPGLKSKALTVGYGQETATLEIVDERADAGEDMALAIRIMAKAKIGDQEISQLAVLPPLVSESGPAYSELPHTELKVFLVEAPLFALKIDSPPGGFELPLEQREIEIPVTIERVEGFEFPLLLEAEHLPEGISVKSIQVGPESATVNLILTGDPKTGKAGRHRVALRAVANIGGRKVAEVSPGFTIQIEQDPLTEDRKN